MPDEYQSSCIITFLLSLIGQQNYQKMKKMFSISRVSAVNEENGLSNVLQSSVNNNTTNNNTNNVQSQVVGSGSGTMPVTTTSSPSNNIPADPQEIKKNNRLTVIQSNNQSFYSNMSSATTTEINSDSKLNQLSTLSTEEGSSGISRRTTPSSQTFGEGGIEGLSNLGRRGRRGSLEHEVKHPVALSKTLDQKVPLMEFIVQKRVENLEYIRKFHEGQVFWMNTVKVSPSEIEKAYQSQTLQKRLEQWFTLGMSMAPLIQIDNGYEFVRACSQLLEEFEYHFSNMAVQGMKILKAFTNNFVDDDTPPVITSQKTIKPSIHKSNGSVVYEFLQTPNIVSFNELQYSNNHHGLALYT